MFPRRTKTSDLLCSCYHQLAAALVISSSPWARARAYTITERDQAVCKPCTRLEQFRQLRCNYRVNINCSLSEAGREISRDDKASGKMKSEDKQTNLHRELWKRHFFPPLFALIQAINFTSESPSTKLEISRAPLCTYTQHLFGCSPTHQRSPQKVT